MALALLMLATFPISSCANEPAMADDDETGRSVVYFTRDISPESLVKIYNALGKKAEGRVAVKISTGESANSNQLSPDLIKDLVQGVNGTLVECNTAYGGSRSTTALHRQAIAERGYNDIATVDIMDEDGYLDIPVSDTNYLQFDRVGSHLANYDFLINLAHFKGHTMGGFGGVLKNQSIGVASRSGKAYIHSCGVSTTSMWGNTKGQDAFLESMAAAAQAVHNYMKGNVVYIDVMNNLSVDCDCDGNPATPEMKDIGVLASLDPVALDKACLDLVFNHESTAGDNSSALIQRINRQHGTHIVDYAEEIGLGTRAYQLIDLDNTTNAVESVRNNQLALLYNVYDPDGKQVLSQAKSLDSLSAGVYIVNGKKVSIK